MRAMIRMIDALQACAQTLESTRRRVTQEGQDRPVDLREGRRVASVGTLHLYCFRGEEPQSAQEDIPVSLLLPGQDEPIEGLLLKTAPGCCLIQTDESMGDHPGTATLVPDRSGLLQTAADRLTDMMRRAEAYHLGTAERLLPLLVRAPDGTSLSRQVESAAYTAVWDSDPAARRARLVTHIADMARANKRILLLCPSHDMADEWLGGLTRQLKLLALPYASLLTRYETDAPTVAGPSPLRDLGFEAQMHRFFARARADKAALRGKYERFKELTPILAYKAEKQKDLNEVKLLEWRLLSQISDLQGKLKEVKATLEAYESIPVWKRLAMQTVGKNIGTLPAYATLYESQIRALMNELEAAQHRIAELIPEATIPKEMKPEYEELKEEIARVGGTKKLRELIAAEEGTNRQAFLQNKRIVIATPARVATDPLFAKVRFDVLIADEASAIPAPFLLAAAALARERILLAGDPRQFEATSAWCLTLPCDVTPPLAATR
jgi:hypothetical protein